MKSHNRLLTVGCSVLEDAYAKCSTDMSSLLRDKLTITSRVKHEGLSFLTMALPDFGKSFERCLATGQVTSSDFSGWRRRRSLPAFLSGLITLVFDAGTGRLYDNPNLAAIEGIRQIAYTFKKILLPCSASRNARAVDGYREVELYLQGTVLQGDCDLFDKVSSLLWGNVLGNDYNPGSLLPKHGPGAVAEGVKANRKYTFKSWHERLEPFFPSDSFLYSGVNHYMDEQEGIAKMQLLQEEAELPVKVTLVPKTLKGPRIIAIEPACMQYAQQAVAKWLIHRLRTQRPTAGHLHFRNQQVNRSLAMSASKDGSLATLDLSEASDRVPLSMVCRMLSVVPDFLDSILACRSRTAKLPTGEILTLKKFASMGSALCFPIEAMYFLVVILVALFRKHKLPVTMANISKLLANVHVFGDDIIVPVDAVDDVVETLAEYYCKVNIHKSFWTGRFRESCGMDAYDGEDVTPTYLRHEQPNNMGDSAALISWIHTRNLFYKRGYWRTAQLMKDVVESCMGRLPHIREDCAVLGWFSFLGEDYQDVLRVRTRNQITKVHGYVAQIDYWDDHLGGYNALLKCLLKLEHRYSQECRFTWLPPEETELGPKQGWEALIRPIINDAQHLGRSPRSGTVSVKRRWTVV